MVNITITQPIVKQNHFDGSTDLITMHRETKELLAAIKNGTVYTVSAELNNWLKYTDPELYFSINQ
jgi:hypothetical protein